MEKQDTKVELTKEWVREIVREEMRKLAQEDFDHTKKWFKASIPIQQPKN